MSKYQKSLVPIIAAVGAVLADAGVLTADMLGEWTSSVVTILVALGVIVMPTGKGYDGKW